MIVKRMKRTKRIGTDFDSPSARPYPPQAEKKSVFIRSIRFIRFQSCRFSKKKRSIVRRRPRIFNIQLLPHFTDQINP
ncbi:MAG: hypothetical protein IPO07_06830 [Haliscomenobacter sp.]|nr:hypothetical protein [Haliscomenobacter sp.]MBK9488518.1 hypothetical protein [Haliscomenobacter sp.]